MIGTKVEALFYGEWHPAYVRDFVAQGSGDTPLVEVLWRGETSFSFCQIHEVRLEPPTKAAPTPAPKPHRHSRPPTKAAPTPAVTQAQSELDAARREHAAALTAAATLTAASEAAKAALSAAAELPADAFDVEDDFLRELAPVPVVLEGLGHE